LDYKRCKDKLVEPGFVPQFLLSNQLLPLYDDFEYFCLTHKYANNYSASDLYLSAYNLTNIFQLENSDFRSITAVDFVDTILTRGNSKGYVKGPTMYMATDDLVVTPMSTTSVISLLSTLSIPFSDLEEKEVTIGIKEVIFLFKIYNISLCLIYLNIMSCVGAGCWNTTGIIDIKISPNNCSQPPVN